MNYEKKIAICIPARYDSKRLPAKLLANFGDKTTSEMTYLNIIKSKLVHKDDIYIFYEKNTLLGMHLKNFCKNIIETDHEECGTDRIARNLNKLPKKYDIICIVQCDEPFINFKNIDFCIQEHIKNINHDFFFSSIHSKIDELTDNSNVKLVLGNDNNVLYYSRNNIPGNKIKSDETTTYNIACGIYVYNFDRLKTYPFLKDTELYKKEGIEQLKVLENGFRIKSFESPYFIEISLDTQENYDYLIKKYKFK